MEEKYFHRAFGTKTTFLFCSARFIKFLAFFGYLLPFYELLNNTCFPNYLEVYDYILFFILANKTNWREFYQIYIVRQIYPQLMLLCIVFPFILNYLDLWTIHSEIIEKITADDYNFVIVTGFFFQKNKNWVIF